MRELELTCLRVNLQQFNGDLVTFLQTGFLDSLKALPVNL
jgi:hypothetical protein